MNDNRPSWNVKEINVQSSGMGIQSLVISILSDREIIPRFDWIIFSDTGWEPQYVYDQLDWLKKIISIPIYVAQYRNILDDYYEYSEYKSKPSMPAYFDKGDNKKTGRGIRQCTEVYKIRQFDRKCRELLGIEKHKKFPVDKIKIKCHMGFSLDEITRCKPSTQKWKEMVYPLLDLDPPWTRQDCINYLKKEFPGRMFFKSSCCGCPFRSDPQWKELQKYDNHGFKTAVMFDEFIRNQDGFNYPAYLHQQLKPLDKVEFNDDQDHFSHVCGSDCGT